MVQPNTEHLPSGFEGCEKKVEIDFDVPADSVLGVRAIPLDAINGFLTKAKCTIISRNDVKKNDRFDAYLLSESSLFIYRTKIILKTCGTTRLLLSVEDILKEAKKLNCEADFLQFSRSNYLFPHQQHAPHRTINEEVEFLNTLLERKGEVYTLGEKSGGPRWYLYIVDFDRVAAHDYKQQTLELIMFNLDKDIMAQFFQEKYVTPSASSSSSSSSSAAVAPMEIEESKECASEVLVNTSGQGYANLNGSGTELGAKATLLSGINKLLPGSEIDAFLFSPCGYSCNGQLGDAYFTIHITPEEHCSFVSFETNVQMKDYSKLVKLVTDTFHPGQFCLSLFVDADSLIPNAESGLNWDHVDGYQSIPGLVKSDRIMFEGGYNARCAHYINALRPDLASSPAAALKKQSDLFCEQSNLVVHKLTDQLAAANDEIAALKARIVELEQRAPSANGTGPTADASMESDTKKRKIEV